MNIALVTPARPRSRNGNRHTALRWAEMLRELGHRVRVVVQWDGRPADAMIALHARRSHASIASFRAGRPEAPLVVVLTGTDLYRDIRSDGDAQASLEMADRLVVLQEQGKRELTPRLRRKTRVIHQSAQVPERQNAPPGRFRATVIGHLREEKDPFRAALALSGLRDLPGIEVLHLGDALDPAMAREAERLMRREPRYRWLGGVPHRRALHWLARSHALVVSSRMEGGANVICEAACAGVPVIASDVSGNVGMLGPRYPAYYPLEDEVRLAALLRRAASDRRFYQLLKRHMRARRPLFQPRAEKAGLRRLLSELRSLREGAGRL